MSSNTPRASGSAFSLIELMIVMAIIGIIAAIAVPQFLTYKVRAHNSGTEALCKQIVNSESALNADLGCWGRSATENLFTLITAPGGSGRGETLTGWDGSIVPATRSVTGALITGGHVNPAGSDTRISAVGFAVPRGLDAVASTTGGLPGGLPLNASFQIITQAMDGNRAFGADSELSDVLFYVQNDAWQGLTGIRANSPRISSTSVDFQGQDGGGAPTATWRVLQ